MKKIIPTLTSILKRHGIVRAGIFGSFAAGKATRKSDIDMLVKYGSKKSLLDLIGLENELERAVGISVDLLTYDSVNPLLKNRIMREEVGIF
ncbi:nucleotidyltransferase family protein [Candidatus Micrarchaeota archaeon]|nr:nucleotidyltransferase family protein [Candidatus Micrarchaeota archaeon]